MKVRTIYFKSDNLSEAKYFWSSFLEIKPHKDTKKWVEFKLENINLGIWPNESDEWKGSNCVPVFEFKDDEIGIFIDKAKSLGAQIILDELENPEILSIIFKDPWGNEFEVSKFH